MGMKGNRQTVLRLAAYAIFCIAILIVPLFTDDAYLLNKFARYIVFGILSLALSLSWGYAGILNLGQAVSFGLGSYCMAMALKLRTIPIQTGATGLPDFMVWNNVDTLPWFWEPFRSYTFAIFAGVTVPVVVAYLIAWFVFRARVNGVYVAIITLAMLVVINLLIIDQQKYTGGFNGITDLTTLKLFGIDFDAYSAALYYLAAITLSLFLFLGLALISSKTGLILQAIRDDETRVWYFGYDVAAYQTFIFCVSAGIAGFAGMLYTLVMEFASPTFLSVPISLSIVIWCAVGGRASLVGAALGAIVVTGVQGALFIIVVLFLPNGLVGLVDLVTGKRRRHLASITAAASTAARQHAAPTRHDLVS
jgi:urea transport system permease protein